MKTVATACLALLVLAVAHPFGRGEEKKAKFDATKLVGTWKYTAGTKSGEKVAQESLAGEVVFTKDTITLPAGPDMKFVMGYKIVGEGSPAKIDMEIKDGPVKEGKAQGIISIEGEVLNLCYKPDMGDGAKRPEKFESNKDNGNFLFELKKAK
jgi:uncharacterized protein (TIGR03067 family)